MYINSGQIVLDTIGNFNFPFLAFNRSEQFVQKNEFVSVSPSDSLYLTIINNDTLDHEIEIDNGLQSSGIILPLSSFTFVFNSSTNIIYSLRESDIKYRMLGLSSFIKVWQSKEHEFFWRLNELESNLNNKIASGQTFNLDSFNPDYFTINDNVHPQIQNDTLAKITGNVGDSIYIFLHNSGEMAHSIHFHGYHVEVLESSLQPGIVSWIKDSIPILSGESQVYLLVPFQEGLYPVHDHNLVATTGGGNYPNGMIVMIDIDP